MENKFMNTQGEVEITYLLNKLKSSFKYVLLISLITLVSVYSLGTVFSKPKYINSTTLIANYETNTEDTGMDQINATRNLAEIYATQLQSNEVMFSIINDLNLDVNPNQLLDKIDIEVAKRTPLIVATYTDKDADKGRSILTSLLQNESIQTFIKNGDLTVLSEASVENQIKLPPSNLKNAIILSIIAGILTTLVIFIKELLNKKIYSENQIKATTNIPVISVLEFDNEYSNHNYLDLRTKLIHSLEKNKVKSIALTSSEIMVDLSNIVHDLARSMTNLEKNILIIELDRDSVQTDDSFKISEQLKPKKTQTKFAEIMHLSENEISQLLYSRNFNEEMKTIKSIYDYIFINAGSINNEETSLLMSQFAERSILFIEENTNTKDDIFNAASQLDSIENEILGIVFSKNNL